MRLTGLARNTLVTVFILVLLLGYFAITQRSKNSTIATSRLPDANSLLSTYFRAYYETPSVAKFYTPHQKQMMYFVKPDIVELKSFLGKPAPELTDLTPKGQERLRQVAESGLAMLKASWKQLHARSDSALDLVDAFDKSFTRIRVAAVIAESDPKVSDSKVIILSQEFGQLCGAAIKERVPRLEWVYRMPPWESFLWDSKNGLRINVLDWGIKKFSSDGVDDGYVKKIEQLAKYLEDPAHPPRTLITR